MSISMSFTLVNRYAPAPVAAPPVASVAPAPAAAPVPAPSCVGDDPQATPSAPRNTLYDAMLAAIERLGATSPAPAATPSETSTAPASEPVAAGDVRSAVYQFSDALFQALDTGSGRQSDVDHDDRKHHGHERSQQVSHGRNGLAHRLAALARQLRDDVQPVASPTPAAPAPATEPAPADGAVGATPVPTTPAPTAPTPAPTTPVPTTPTTPTTPAAPAEPTVPAAPAVPTAPATPASSPLADAFAGLVDALLPAAPTASAGTDLVSRLATFLHQLAGALQSAPIAAAPAPVGLLIDTTA